MSPDTIVIVITVVLVIAFAVALVMFTSSSSPNPLAELTKVIHYIKNGTFSVPIIQTQKQEFDLFTMMYTSSYVSSYYGSASYQSDLNTLLQITKDTTSLTILPQDCYPLSTQVTSSMTPDDLKRVGNNLLLKIEPTLLVLCNNQQYGNMAAELVLFFNMIYSVLGVNGSQFIVPTYDANGNLLTVRYANGINRSGNIVFLPVSYYLGILTNGYGPNNVTIPFMTPAQISTFLTAQQITSNRQALVTSIITNITNPLNNQVASLLQQYPDSVFDLPADLFSKLIMTLLFTVWAGAIQYNGMNCA